MRKLTLSFFIIILCQPESMAQIKGKLISIHDGDTFTILLENNNRLKIRLYGADCPELGQPYGYEARNFSRSLLINKTIKIQPKSKDRYGRTIAIVTITDSSILNEQLILSGLAWHDIKYDHSKKWDSLQTIALASKLGIWSSNNPVKPWVFRKTSNNKPKIK